MQTNGYMYLAARNEPTTQIMYLKLGLLRHVRNLMLYQTTFTRRK